MSGPAAENAFAAVSCRRARIWLGLFAAAVLFCVGVSLSPGAQGFADKPSRGASDPALYRAEIDRIHAGENYYAAAAQELPGRGYPTASPFNWRTPLPMWLAGILPNPVLAKALLGGLALLALLLGFELSAQESGSKASVVTVLLLVGALFLCLLSDLFVMPVLWAGVLIAISVCAFGLKRPKLGVAAGIAAVFVRDMAGPYCAVGLGIALCRRRFQEATLWMAGLAAYAVFFAAHCWAVGSLQLAGGRAHAESWLQLGGAAFVISTVQMNGFLLLLPQWVAAIYLPLALLGFASWKSDAGQRAGLAAALYVILFAFVGHDFNQYWGSLVAPLFCLGAGRGVLAIADLWRATGFSQSSATASLTTAGS